MSHCNDDESGCLDQRAATCGCDCPACFAAEDLRRKTGPAPVEPAFEFNAELKRLHDRTYADERCLSCMSCYMKYGVGYKDPACRFCYGICSAVHMQEIVAELRARKVVAA